MKKLIGISILLSTALFLSACESSMHKDDGMMMENNMKHDSGMMKKDNGMMQDDKMMKKDKMM
ncbi:MAG: hypothetical protein Q9N62_10365 [Ghiorsea sp.]|nr:hypothetical protein [Ghiorsea sp.]